MREKKHNSIRNKGYLIVWAITILCKAIFSKSNFSAIECPSDKLNNINDLVMLTSEVTVIFLSNLGDLKGHMVIELY
jgi:hypothetical protein